MDMSAPANNRSYRLVLALLASTVLLSGCAAIAPATQIETASRTIESLPSIPPGWTSARDRLGDVTVGWVAAFDDPLLVELVAEAQRNNRDLRAAAANVRRSWAAARQARAGLLPRLDGVVGAQHGAPLEGGAGLTGLNIGLQASWEADIWSKIEAGEQAAAESARSAEAGYIFSQYSLAASVAQSYFLVVEAGEQVGVAKGIFDALTETTRVAQLRYRYGESSAYDVSLVRADLAAAADTLENAMNGRLVALRALEGLIGRYPSATLETPDMLPAIPPPPPAGLPSELLSRRPDVIAAERSVAAAINGRRQAEAAKLPSLSLSGTLGGSSNDLSNILDPTNVAWMLAANILAPIFDGGGRDAQVDIADADVQAAVAAYAGTAIAAFGDVENALDAGVFLRRRRLVQESAVEQSENALRLSMLQYKAGEIALIDVLSIQQRVFSRQSNLLALKRAQLDQYVALNLALGGDWQTQVAE